MKDVVRVGNVNAQHRLKVVAIRVLLVVVGEAVVTVSVLQVEEIGIGMGHKQKRGRVRGGGV